MTIDTDPKFSVGSIPECQLACQNDGYCTYISTDEGTLIEIFSSGGMIEHCVCPPGFSGLACENVAEQCNYLKCQNGAPCTLKDGQYICDCDAAEGVSRFAGSMCREPATSYCGAGVLQNRSFCTNGGLCLGNILHQSSKYSTHSGCRCPPEFEGPHCEYLKGMSPDAAEEPHLTSSYAAVPMAASIKSSGNGVFAYVGIFVAAAMSIFGLVVMAQYRKRSRRHRDIVDDHVDQTPIRVRIFSDDENLESMLEDGDRYVDKVDLYSIAECSLEEIELDDNSIASKYRDYLQGIRDGGYETYFDSNDEQRSRFPK